MTCDLHCHSRYSFDGSAPLDAICRCALERGISVVAITDHCDMTDGPEGIQSYLRGEKELQHDFAEAKVRYPQLELLYGVEIGNAIDMPERTQIFLQQRTFDFVIGAIHFLPDGSDIYRMSFAGSEDIDAMFSAYFESMLALVDLGGFDSLAHLDYPMRVLQGKVNDTSLLRYRSLIEPILEALVRQKIALEINTRGTYDWQHRVGPEDWVLAHYRALGGRQITIGSDAHTAALVGEGYDQAVAALLRTGFSSYTVYQKREPIQILLTGSL